MKTIAMLVALLLSGQFDEGPTAKETMPIVEQDVEVISIAHLEHGVTMAFFWDRVQGDFTCLDHRWVCSDWLIYRDGDRWCIAWTDDMDECYRVLRTRCYVESWEKDNPLDSQRNQPWFAGLLQPGLKKPPTVK